MVRITTHDLLVSTNRNTGGIVYERLEHALDRLAGTRIKTNIETGDEKIDTEFRPHRMVRLQPQGSGFAERLRYLDIKLSDWLFRAIEAAEVLPISRDYFRLRRPLDRRVYEVGRKHCGMQDKWRISIEKLQRRTGSKQERKHFAAHMRSMVQSNHLPDYALTLEAGPGGVLAARERGPMPIGRAVLHNSRCSADARSTPERRIMVSSQAIEQLYEIAPRWDKYTLENLYIAWAKDKEVARNEDARFLSWVRSYTKGKPAP